MLVVHKGGQISTMLTAHMGDFTVQRLQLGFCSVFRNIRPLRQFDVKTAQTAQQKQKQKKHKK